MITVYLNDVPHSLESSMSVANLLIQNQVVGEDFAIALNNKLLPRIQYATTEINADDRIDVIVPMQGG